MKQFLIFLNLSLISISFNCNYITAQSLKNDNLIRKHFDEDEISDLEKILYFFDKEITKNCNNNFYECYDNYFKSIKDKFIKKDFGILEIKEDSLLKNINQTTFSEIWDNSFSYKNKKRDSVNIIIINVEGQFMNFLKEFSSERPFIYHYFDSIKTAGTIGAGSINYMFIKYDKFNIKDEKERLIIAIHYLTLNKQMHCTNSK